ncbi:hypothetical protein, partial [Hydrogenimonas sp.]
HDGWTLALFLFLYALFGYYVFKPMLALFFLLGIPIMNLQNEMFFHFGLFLNTLFIFYLFLFVLLFFYYIPFPTQPERIFLELQRRFLLLAGWMKEKEGFKERYARKYLMPTLQKMKVWASQIDYGYFQLDAAKVTMFLQSAETYARSLLENDPETAKTAEKTFEERLKTIDFDRLRESRF